jgi:hypothetical protein
MARISRSGWTVVRSQDGNTYGPIDLDTLQAWATDGRLEPEDKVQDRNHEERPASDWEILKMEWVVRLPSGKPYGPTTAGAIRAMLTEGELSEDAAIRNVRTGETGVLGRHPLFHPAGMVRADEVSLPIGPQDLESVTPPPAAEPAFESAESPQSSPFRWDLSRFSAPAVEPQPMADMPSGAVAPPSPEASAPHLPPADRKELEKQIQDLETRLAKWKQFSRQYFLVGDREHHNPNQVELDELSRQLLTSQEKNAELEGALELMESQLQQRILENDRLIEERQNTHRFYRLQLEGMFQQIQSEQSKTRRIQDHLAKAQRAHIHLLQQYRDLHQQYVDLQDELRQVRQQTAPKDH